MILEQADIFNRVVNGKSRGDLDIVPWTRAHLQPASYELALASTFLTFNPQVEVIDPLNLGDYTREVKVEEGCYLVLHPGEFVIGSTVESFRFPRDLVGMLNGKSSLGRLGLQVHATAGFFDPGFRGTATLEMSNISRLPIRLWPGMMVAQMAFLKLSRTSQFPYGSAGLRSRYQDQDGPTASRYNQRLTVRRPEDAPEQVPEQLRLPGVQWDQYVDKRGS
jgi:dCTP deaminase